MIADRSGRLSAASLRWLSGHAQLALGELGVGGEVRVAVVDDEEMSAAHERHCGVGGTTDVITFDLSGDPGWLDADLLVCVGEGERQGARLGHGADRELLLYVVHGVLHCLGHDDREAGAAARMHEREDEVLRAIGVGVTYGVGVRDGGGLR